MAASPGDQFEPPYVGSYNEGVHGEGLAPSAAAICAAGGGRPQTNGDAN